MDARSNTFEGTDSQYRAAVLVEALPYIRRFSGKIIVVKYGGSTISKGGSSAFSKGETSPAGEGPEAGTRSPVGNLAWFAQDVMLMRSVGMLPVVVHGGGPQIGELMAKLGMTTRFVDGLRVTDAETLEVARMVLVGKVNREIVGAINMHAPLAVGLSGEDAGLITASAHRAELGFVGDVDDVDPGIVHRLLAQGIVPVIATIGTDQAGQAYNINADTVAGALAQALGAEKLVFLTDVEGVRLDPSDRSSLVQSATASAIEDLIASGTIQGGMIPKAEACIAAVRNGVRGAHILDGRVPHALLLEMFTNEGVGTMVSS
ncbi:MAG: acetylglutamate kinase [Actinobacteria bacterium]|nr:acetylglutamate kinase [Actinomycetota bacterium]